MKTAIVQFNELQAELTTLVAPTLILKVTDFPSSASAIEAAKAVKALQRRIEAKRKELVDPLNHEVKAINEYAKSIVAPLDKAEVYLKTQLVDFQREQDRIRQEELRKAEEERKRLEAELQAKHDAEQAAIVDETEIADMFGSDSDEPSVNERAAELEKAQIEESARLTQQAKEREFDIRAKGIKNARKNWKCEVTDITAVPKEFLIITLNQAAVLAAARGGLTQIPGVRLWQETSIAIGANTYVPELTGSRK